MCGIAGIMALPGEGVAPVEVLDGLEGALLHRGPDGRGRYVTENVGLVHTRLAIIDLNTGDQPFFAPAHQGGQAAIVANGEIYNYVELRKKMTQVTFTSHSDCELPLHLYLRYGISFTEHLRGMYGLAIYDPDRGQLVLARDPFGIKPLYYTQGRHGFAFASEIGALAAAGLVQPEVNSCVRDQTLQLQFPTGRETALRGVYRVLPGEVMIVEKGQITKQTRKDPLPLERPRRQSEGEALRDLDRLLDETVALHQRADVPHGIFLSGGIDSSVLLAMMVRLNQRPLLTFTAGFPGSRVHDEQSHARSLAQAVGADHVEVSFKESDFWTLLPEVAGAIDDPAADYAAVPTYKLAKAAQQAGIKVVLSGEGGDEVFGGYSRYRRAMRWAILGGRPMYSRAILDQLDVLRQEKPSWHEGIAASEKRAAQGHRSRLQTVQAIDMLDWLPNNLLTKLDRCLMAHGVEGRVPFLDTVLAEFAFCLPDNLKVRRGLGKWLLRRWLETRLPAARPFSAKRGFTVPAAEWILARGKELGPLVANQPGIQEACKPNSVERLFLRGGRRQGRAAWTLLFYALWHHRHILRMPHSGGDALDELGLY